jgi:hypothetical protein
MTVGSPRGPQDGDRVPKAYVSLISLCFSELRKDMRDLVRSGWEESVRRRAHELAVTLTAACERQGLADLAGLARSLAGLARLSRSQALPLRAALREKSEALLQEAALKISRCARRDLGGSG